MNRFGIKRTNLYFFYFNAIVVGYFFLLVSIVQISNYLLFCLGKTVKFLFLCSNVLSSDKQSQSQNFKKAKISQTKQFFK